MWYDCHDETKRENDGLIYVQKMNENMIHRNKTTTEYQTPDSVQAQA